MFLLLPFYKFVFKAVRNGSLFFCLNVKNLLKSLNYFFKLKLCCIFVV